MPDYFQVERFRVDVERRHNAQGELETFSEATVRVNIDGQSLISAAEGTGPVHALYIALCKDLGKYQQYIEDIELLDFRVRVFQGGADAVTRVLVEFGDKQGEHVVHRRRVAQSDRRALFRPCSTPSIISCSSRGPDFVAHSSLSAAPSSDAGALRFGRAPGTSRSFAIG